MVGLLLLCSITKNLYAQVQDTTHLQQDTSRAAIIVEEQNSILETIQQNNEADSSKFFYEKLKRVFSKTKLTRELYRMLFREPYQNTASRTLTKAEDPYKRYNGRIIGNITIQALDPFGPRVNDTLKLPNNWFEKAGNTMHITTRSRVVRKGLLFSKGDEFNSLLVSNNERVLRQQSPHLLDARIFVLPRIKDKDTVDIHVVTQDIWSISGDLAFNGLKNGNIRLNDSNIFGLGHQLQNQVLYDSHPDKGWGYRGLYNVPFIGKTFINGQLHYINEWNQSSHGLRLRRSFLTPSTKYAGGLELSQNRYLQQYVPFGSDTVFATFPYAYTLVDVWLGRAFQFNAGNERFRESSRLIVAGRIIGNNFYERPVVRSDTNNLYWNSFLSLMSIGISNRSYFRDVLIYGFGRTEDVPYGGLFSITSGAERREFGERFYLGTKASYGKYYNRFGYLATTLDAGSFIRGKNWEQGVFRLEANYFSRLLMLKTLRIRQFVNIRYTKGIGRFDQEFIEISNSNGIRGIGSSALRGTKSLVLNLETVFFTPLNILGFQVATFAYADLGMITPANINLFEGTVFQGYGLGFRVRNENLTFNTFQFRLGFYPNIPNNQAVIRTQFSGIPSLRLYDFDIAAPETITFGRRL